MNLKVGFHTLKFWMMLFGKTICVRFQPLLLRVVCHPLSSISQQLKNFKCNYLLTEPSTKACSLTEALCNQSEYLSAAMSFLYFLSFCENVVVVVRFFLPQ